LASQYSEQIAAGLSVGLPHRQRWAVPLPASIIDVALTPNASLIVAGCVNRQVYVFSSNGDLEWERDTGNEVWSVAITADAHRIAAGTANKNVSGGAICVYDRRGRPVWKFAVGAPVWSVNFSPDGRYLVAGAWNNKVYCFESDGQQYSLCGERQLGAAGVYGVAISPDAERIFASIYDDGVYQLRRDLTTVAHYEPSSAAYRIAVSLDGRAAFAGLRSGAVVRMTEESSTPMPPVASRAVCGVATNADGSLWMAGSFDGTVTLGRADGVPLWTTSLGSEIWGVAGTIDLSAFVLAAGDGTLRYIVNNASTSALRELEHVERAVRAGAGPWADRQSVAASLRDCYARYGVISYGVHRFEQWREQLGGQEADAALLDLLLADVREHPEHSYSHSRLALRYDDCHDWHKAAYHHLQASRDPKLKLVSLTGAGDALMQLNWRAGAQSCFRRAREQDIDNAQKQVLYNLARSYEDAGDLPEARKHYEILLTWDPDYRDVWQRARSASGAHAPAASPDPRPERDYAELTVRLLGPDVPRANEVDPTLRNVLDARAKEFAVTTAERQRLYRALASRASGETTLRTSPTLRYDVAAYMKYDYLLPEDEVKKEIELINLLAVLEATPVGRSLDIGAATGRHPGVLARRGIAAFGMDIELEAMSYAHAKPTLNRYPQFSVGDGRCLSFQGRTFDLVTCMMGTIAHMPPGEQGHLCREVARVLRPDGLFVISTWDVDCRHLAFLSMYTHAQKEMIRRNSMCRDELAATLQACGFAAPRIIPFALLPETFSFESGAQGMEREHIARILEIDLAARGAYPQMHGEMFLAVATVPGVVETCPVVVTG